MDRTTYLRIMQFPDQWLRYEMIPDDLLEELVRQYEPGHESASEHDRNGVFHWWLKRNPPKDVLVKLVELSFLDPDQVMAKDVRSYILTSENTDKDVKALLG